MFAPVGYIPLIDLFEAAYNEDYQAHEYLDQADLFSSRFYADMPNDIVKQWIMDFCKEELHLTKDGSFPIRISHIPFTRGVFRWGAMCSHFSEDLIITLKLTDELMAQHDLCEEVSRKDASDFSERGEFFSDAVNTDCEINLEQQVNGDEIAQSLDSTYIDKIGHVSPKLFLDYRTGTISMKLYDHLSKLDDEADEAKEICLFEDMVSVAGVLRQFDGYAVCIPERLYHEGWKDFWNMRGEKELDDDKTQLTFSGLEDQSEQSKKTERMVEREFCLFLTENGCPKITKERFAAKFASGLKVRAQQRVWAKVAQDFPYLSKPGRKS
ncbi:MULTISPECIES: hypothetical protein [unclassified Falsihalocynthiibacter]|uniref:hypothetical protein n=1 Tax=unclassified Falsihalocynthiibacter TaxID=2854191 RepID=UPI00350F1F4C